jgi:hypothetical protein
MSSVVDRKACCFTRIKAARAHSTGRRNTFNRGGVAWVELQNGCIR